MKKILINIILPLLILSPIFAFSQGVPIPGDSDFIGPTTTPSPDTPTDLRDILCTIAILALNFVPWIMMTTMGVFLIGLIKYVGHGDDEEKRGEGTKMMVYGLLGLFFMVSIWGILKLFVSSFDLRFGIPQFKESSSGTNRGCSVPGKNYGFHN